VQNDEKASSYCSVAMTEAFEMFRRPFFMLSFVELFDGCRSVQYLNKLLTRFIEISTDTFDRMNPKYARLQLEEEGEVLQDKYVDPLFLQEHDVRYEHMLQVLQHKLAESNTNDKQKITIHEMLGRVKVLNTLLHT
jgi:hypothetical protein